MSGPFYSKTLLNFKTFPAYPTSSLTPEDTVFDSSFWTALVAIMAGIGIFCCVFLIVFYTVFRKNRVVRRANLLFIYAFLTGIACVFLSLILWTLVQTTFLCTTKTLLGMIGFGFIVGALTAKCQRYYRVFINYGYIEPVMTTKEFLIWWSIPVILDIGLALFYIIGPDGLPTATITQSVVDNTYIYITCVPGTKDRGTNIVVAYLLVNGIFTICNAVALFFSRNLLTPFKEGSFLFLIVPEFMTLIS